MNTKTRTDHQADEGLFYTSNPYLRTQAAQDDARAILNWERNGRDAGTAPDEKRLFTALHTCAYLASAQRPGASSASTRRRWYLAWRRLRETVVQRNLGLVYTMLDRFRTADSDDDDLTSEAMLGLARAVDRFDPWRGFRFSTYACNCIARACMRRARMEARHRLLFPVAYDAALDSPYEPENTDSDLRIERIQHAIKSNCGDLTALESKVLRSRFPLGQSERLTFQQIGRAVGLSKERVRQIQNEALEKLRTVLREDPLLK